MIDLTDLPIVTNPSESFLNQRQLLDYRSEREECLQWLLTLGKNSSRGEGYARGTVKPRAYRMDQFYRWVWTETDGYTLNVSTDHADQWMQELAVQDYSQAHKANCQKAIKMLYKWREHQRGGSHWEPTIQFSSQKHTQPRDYLTQTERRQIREAALEYGSIPGYNDLTPPERDRWKRYLSQRFGKSKADIEPSDWDRANSWMIPSLVWTSLDAGLRPVEVGQAATSWVDTENAVLRIPKEESVKSTENWIVSLREQTATALNKWLDQRPTYPKYDDTDLLWLTREGNPYDSNSLQYLLEQLCDIAGIDISNRQMSWYAIRHSVGTYMTREEDLAAAQSQLRHKSAETTMKYDQTPVDDRRDALDRMG